MSDDLLNIFWVEVREHLDTLNATMLQVEMLTEDEDEQFNALVRELNRVAHSMKGAARAVGISTIESISHYMEEIFGGALNHRIRLDTGGRRYHLRWPGFDPNGSKW